jgi:hypothetical protein
MKRVGMFGYSRDVARWLRWPAALDERIAALIAGSTGVGGILPVAAVRRAKRRRRHRNHDATIFRPGSSRDCASSPAAKTACQWIGNLLVAMIAPRSVLMEYGLNDEVSNSWGSEQTYHSAMRAYKLMGQPDRVGLLRVPGFHGANDQEACLDWLTFSSAAPPVPGPTIFFFLGTSTNGARRAGRPSI